MLTVLARFKMLEDGWYGIGERKYRVEFIDRVTKLVNQLIKQPSIFFTGRDSVQLEYEKENGDYLEFEVYEGKIVCLKIIGKDEVEKEVEECNMNRLIEDFYNN